MKRYLGVDLHRAQITVCTRLENGRTYSTRALVMATAMIQRERNGARLRVHAVVRPKVLDRYGHC
jgi:hypothetical protein